MSRQRPHPVVVSRGTATRIGGNDPGAETLRRRSVPGLTLIRGLKLPADVLLRHRGRRFARLHSFLNAKSAELRPYYRRRDMLGAFLRLSLHRANVAEIEVSDSKIHSIALEQDEEGRTRVVVRSKRGRKANDERAA